MFGHKALVIGLIGAWLCGGAAPGAVSAAEPAVPAHQAAGEIVWLDIQLGQLQLSLDHSRGARTTAQYNITQQDTRVTDHSDKQFLAITDLRAGQRVKIESKASGHDQIATKITVEPTTGPLFETAEGRIESIDAGNPGSLTLNETANSPAAGTATVFTFDPQSIVVMESPSLQPVRLEVKPGDFVRVGYVVKDGKRYARSMMRYAVVPAPAHTTTTVTTQTTTTTQ